MEINASGSKKVVRKSDFWPLDPPMAQIEYMGLFRGLAPPLYVQPWPPKVAFSLISRLWPLTFLGYFAPGPKKTLSPKVALPWLTPSGLTFNHGLGNRRGQVRYMRSWFAQDSTLL